MDGKYPKESFATIKYADFETGLNDKGKAVAALFKDMVKNIVKRTNYKKDWYKNVSHLSTSLKI